MKSVLTPYFNKVRGKILPGAHRLQKLVSPQLQLGILNIPCILVTGSNGKGSVCAYLEQILRDHDFKTGLYTSPHLVHPNERIRLDGIPVSESILEQNIFQIEEQSKLYLPDASFFELTTATALLIFLNSKIDFLICEVGLGGHFDSTNALSPIISVLTSVSLEHTEYLGSTLKKIASDKSHISRRNRPLILAQVPHEALEGVKETVNKVGSYIVPVQHYNDKDINLNTALTAINKLSEEIHFNFSKEKIQTAIKKTFWPGRFDVRNISTREVIFDAAHNPAGFDFFVEKYNESPYKNKKCVLLFSSLSDKDWHSIFKKIHLIADYVILTNINTNRAENIENFQYFIQEMKLSHCPFPKYEIIECAETSVQAALKVFPSLPLVITGSIAFIGNIMEYLGIEVFSN